MHWPSLKPTCQRSKRQKSAVRFPVPGYRLRSCTRLHWTSWNDEYVVFDETSGQTNQLDAVRAYVLHLLSEAVHTHDGVLQELSKIPALAELHNQSAMLTEIFDEFVAAGLAETVDVLEVVEQ